MKKKLLLHACCGPCSSGVLEKLCRDFDVTILFYNPNIYPESEYDLRKAALEKLLDSVDERCAFKLVALDYDASEFEQKVTGYENEPEGGKRCEICFLLRMEKACRYALQNDFDLFTTTLSVSPYKNAKLLNEIGQTLSEKYAIDYLYADFKKDNGYLQSVQNSKKYDLYRQSYCGCKFSKNIRL